MWLHGQQWKNGWVFPVTCTKSAQPFRKSRRRVERSFRREKIKKKTFSCMKSISCLLRLVWEFLFIEQSYLAMQHPTSPFISLNVCMFNEIMKCDGVNIECTGPIKRVARLMLRRKTHKSKICKQFCVMLEYSIPYHHRACHSKYNLIQSCPKFLTNKVYSCIVRLLARLCTVT